MTPVELSLQIAKILDDKKAQDIVALNVHDLTVITDCMVIASGRNSLQVKAIADEVQDKLAQAGIEPLRTEGWQEAKWIILDYGTVLVHMFHTEAREFYRLDRLWEHDGNRIPLPIEEDE